LHTYSRVKPLKKLPKSVSKEKIMDKYEQITKLVEAAALIQEVINSGDCPLTFELEEVNVTIADLADEIEGVE
jgi:hypothetical protein